MRLKHYLLFSLALGLFSCSSETSEPSVDEPVVTIPVEDVKLESLKNIELVGSEVDANVKLNDFSFRFFNTVAKDVKKGNVSVSPISVGLCMSMVANSIDAENRANHAKVLGYDNFTVLNEVCNKLIRHLPCEENGAIMHLANSVWYHQEYTANQDYISLMNNTFGAEVASLDLRNFPVALKTVNDWCARNTNNLIPEVLSELKGNESMILANALYFGGDWACEFPKALSKQAKFYGTEKTSYVNMMNQGISTQYASDGEYELITLPFEGHKTRMVLVLPKKGVDIFEAAESFDFARWQSLSSSTRMVDADLYLPSFRVERDMGLNDVLGSMGMNLSQVSLPCINNPASHDLYVLHKTVTIVNEEGAEAAAVTVTEGILSPGPGDEPELEKVEITFDRPFMYFIENVKTGSILMAGRVANI